MQILPAARPLHRCGGRAAVLAATALAGLGLAACAPSGADAADGEEREAASDDEPAFEGLKRAQATKVLTTPLGQREMVRLITTTVTAESETEIQVFPRTAGMVQKVLVEEGDRVRKDDVLLELDPREFQAALDEARIALREAEDAKRNLQLTLDETVAMIERAQLTYDQSKRELERKEDASNVISRNDLDLLRLSVSTNKADLAAQEIASEKARAALASQEIAIERAQLQIARAELDLSFTKVVAPFDGVIARRDVRIGDLVSNAASVFVLTDMDNVRAVVSRAQRELSFFREAEERARKASDGDASGREALDIVIEPEALPGSRYTGRILFVSPTIDPTSGQFRVTIGVDQPGAGDPRRPVLPGMLLRVRIVTERHPDALVVPKRALLREGDSYFVFVVEDEAARRVRVREGFTDDEEVEVIPETEGSLQAGGAIVVVGNRELDDGDRVEPAPWRVEAASTVSSDEAAEADEDATAGEDDA
ncbi:MAG: efflux RND transporter periplasmic adaptor subunit [Planctomycetota bacterium]